MVDLFESLPDYTLASLLGMLSMSIKEQSINKILPDIKTLMIPESLTKIQPLKACVDLIIHRVFMDINSP